LLRAKWRDLRRGIDNVQYIEDVLETEKKKKELRDKLKEKYDYKNKIILEEGQPVTVGLIIDSGGLY
jgi:uncharacterized protein (UPF0305 family)